MQEQERKEGDANPTKQSTQRVKRRATKEFINYRAMIESEVDIDADPDTKQAFLDLLTTLILVIKKSPPDLQYLTVKAILSHLPADITHSIIQKYIKDLADAYNRLQRIASSIAPRNTGGDMMTVIMDRMIQEWSSRKEAPMDQGEPVPSRRVKIVDDEEFRKALFGDGDDSKEGKSE